MGEVILMSDLDFPKKKKETSFKISIWDVIKLEDRYLYKVLPDGIWKDRRCFIVGGGPSLKGFNFSLLKGELTIGINRAFEKFDPTIIFSMDSRFWTWVEEGKFGKEVTEKFHKYKGFKVWLNTFGFPYPEDIYLLNSATGAEEALTFSMKEGLGHGNNSGYAALNLAICLGANPIYLLGFDMKGDNGKQKWWHDGYPQQQNEDVYKDFKSNFEKAAPKIKEAGFKVINLNPDSALRCFEFGEFEDIKPIKRPLIVSYYTKNTGYEKEAKRLEESIKKFGLEYDIEEIESLGDWQKNTHYKATFIRKMMDRHPNRDLLWLDVDAVVHRYPILFDDIDTDLAIHYKDGKELLSGTLYFSNNERIKKLVDAWIEENKKNPDIWEQKNLATTLKNWNGKVEILPPTYCQIFDLMMNAGEPIIEHFQASRRYK